jgi:hypothetical protein
MIPVHITTLKGMPLDTPTKLSTPLSPGGSPAGSPCGRSTSCHVVSRKSAAKMAPNSRQKSGPSRQNSADNQQV